jgi:hypothetical protein
MFMTGLLLLDVFEVALMKTMLINVSLFFIHCLFYDLINAVMKISCEHYAYSYIFFTVCILLCVTSICFGNVIRQHNRNGFSISITQIEFIFLQLHVSVLMGPTSGSIIEYD